MLTCVSNRINDLRVGEEMLLEGIADVVAMARPFLADREIVAKSRQQRFDEVNRCIACNQDCMDHMFLGQEVGCSVNPECSTTTDGEPLAPLPAGTRVAVVGGGLAGMSAAYYLRRRGADVTLFEQSHRLGGQMQLAAKIPTKSEFAETIRSFEVRLRKSGTRVVLDHEFSEADIGSQRWSHVVVATGTEPKFCADRLGASPIPGMERETGVQVLGWHDLLHKNLPIAFPVVIYGGGGVACDIAKFLLSKRRRVWLSEEYLQKYEVRKLVGELPALKDEARQITIAQRSSKKIGYKLGRTTRWITMDELEARGVQMLRSAVLEGVCSEGVNLRVQGEPRTFAAATLVMATGQRPTHEALCRSLAQAGLRFTLIGAASADQTEPASISFSIKSGYRFATTQIDQVLGPVAVRATEMANSTVT